ncbi:MAG: hypothetical protein FWE04_05395 [Oscillospiraceae bacterium]|nr:hypothetical protein [Oscillospiraceae bacterium]
MKNDKIVNAYDKFQLSEVSNRRILEKIKQKQQRNKKRPVFRTAISLATTAAVLMFALFGVRFFTPDSNNFFALQAYAMEVREDGTIELRMLEYANFNYSSHGVWHGHYDGENFYLNIAIGFIGENIKQVEFTTDFGFFAKQFIDRESITDDIHPTTSGGRILRFGDDFEIIGNSFIVDESFIADDWILFLGQEGEFDMDNRHRTVRAIATFNDGTTQEEVININLEDRFGWITMDENVTLESQRQFEIFRNFYENVPLEDLELIHESVKTFTDYYEFQIDESRFVLTFRWFDGMEEFFDENGVLQRENTSWVMDDDGEGAILIVQRNDNGTFTGRVYLVPQELIDSVVF